MKLLFYFTILHTRLKCWASSISAALALPNEQCYRSFRLISTDKLNFPHHKTQENISIAVSVCLCVLDAKREKEKGKRFYLYMLLFSSAHYSVELSIFGAQLAWWKVK